MGKFSESLIYPGPCLFRCTIKKEGTEVSNQVSGRIDAMFPQGKFWITFKIHSFLVYMKSHYRICVQENIRNNFQVKLNKNRTYFEVQQP